MGTEHFEDPFAGIEHELDAVAPVTGIDRKAPIHMPAPETLQGGFTERCKHCRGTGKFVTFTGRVLGPCFKCKGAGEINFKTSPEARSKGRASAAVRKANREAEKAAWREQHKELISWMEKEADRFRTGKTSFDFIHNMCEKIAEFGTLTDPQLQAVLKCKAKSDERLAAWKANRPAAPAVDTAKIEEAFEAARQAARDDQEGVKWLRLRLDTFTFSDAPATSQWPAAIFVKEGDRKLGRITGGKFQASFACDDPTKARILAAIADPEQAAKAFGQRTGSCSICGRELTNAESRAAGIGPICAEKFGW